MNKRMGHIALAASALAIGLLARQGSVSAVGSGQPISVLATVDQLSLLDCAVQEFTHPALVDVPGPTVQAMDYGTVHRRTESVCANHDCNNNGVLDEPIALVWDKFFKVFCGINTSGKAYTLSQNGDSLAAGGNATLNSAWIVVPVQATNGQNPPSFIAGTLGPCDLAVGQSNLFASSQGAVVETVYSITDAWPTAPRPGNSGTCGNQPASFIPIPPDQPAGTYQSQVTLTLTVQ